MIAAGVVDGGPAFQAFGVAHSIVIALTGSLPFVGLMLSRNGSRRGMDLGVRLLIAALLALNYAGYAIDRCHHGSLRWQEMLPFQLCDWTMIAVIIALLNGGRARWLEVAYFWGIGGSLQAIITPNLPVGFPSIRFISFFVDHCGIVIGIVYLMISRRFRPTFASIWRTLFWSEIYLATALLVDHITGVNYGFLLHKPEAASLLSLLSDSRPLYLLQMQGVAMGFFVLLYAPFAIRDVMERRPLAA